MSENLLSVLHIQKLGHPIEEIRNRALSSIISKYNLNLVDENNLQNTKLLLQKLFEWFTYDKYSEEKKVLNLILKILKYRNAYLILNEPELSEIFKTLNEIKKKLGSVHFSKIEEIIEVIETIKEESKENYPVNFKAVGGCVSKNLVDLNFDTNYKKECDLQRKSDFPDENLYIERNPLVQKSSTDSEKSVRESATPTSVNFLEKSIYEVEYFPWQSLVPNDKQVIASVFQGLKYIDEKNSILQSCQFFYEVILRDFPIEIFLQRPLLIRTFLQLLSVTKGEIKISVLKSLIQTIKCLNKSIKLICSPSIFNQKKEYYTTSVFPESAPSSDFYQPELTNLCENLNYSLPLNDCLKSDDFETSDENIKKYQLSVQEFFFEVLTKTLPQLDKSCTREEANYILELSFETIVGLIKNLKYDIWRNKNNLQNKFYKVFAMLQDLLKLNKMDNKVTYILILNFIILLLDSLKPPSPLELAEILPRGLHIELGESILDFVIVLMFPSLHKRILHYVEFLVTPKEKEYIMYYKEVLVIFKSMRSAIHFLKNGGKIKSKMEKLQCIYEALQCLDFHQNSDFIQGFFYLCLLKWCKSELQDEELKLLKEILLKLLAYCEDSIKVSVYQELRKNAVKYLGEEEATNPKYEIPGDKMEFLFHTDVLTEIICHGLTSELEEVRSSSNDILIHLLRSRFLMSENCWNDFLASLTPCLSLLQCHADKSSKLGRCLVKLFDPDVANSTGLPEIELLKGNIRFLYSKDNLIRDEAVSRLFWLLGREDSEKRKLPRISILTGLNLSGICSSVQPRDYTKVQQSFYSPGKLCDVVEMLTSEIVEPNVRRSALSQLCVMLEDNHLHSTFLEQKGLKAILDILESCLVERQYRNYPDSVMPIIEILKLLSSENVCVRQELSRQTNVFYNVLRGLFLFSGDERLRRNAAELLCLLLYSDCILNVPSDNSLKCTISFPEIVVKKICLPFLTHVHLKSSRHFEPSVKKTLLSNESCSKLIRVYWAIQWTGGLPELLGIGEAFDLNEKSRFPEIADDLRITHDDITCLKRCSFPHSVKQTLYSIQNATTHETACFGFFKLHRFRLLYSVSKATFGRGCNDVCSEAVASHMHWESTLERFMLHTPFCFEDESLLLEVIRFLKKLLRSFTSSRLIDWTEKLLTDSHQPLFGILRNLGNENCGLKGRELRLSIIELAQQIVTSKLNPSPSKWFMYLELMSDLLKLDKTKEFYNVAYVDCVVGLLVDLTGKCIWCLSDKTNFLQCLISRIMEVIMAFHCTHDSAVSFMGINIIKNSILVLNHILADSQIHVKNWEEVWFQALSKVIGHENLNYCWLLSLLFMRDTIIRASAYQLFVGFTTTLKSCFILLDQLNIPCDQLWTQATRVLFDENESCLIREKCGHLLSNLMSYKNKKMGSLVEYLKNVNFFGNVLEVISNFQGDYETRPLVLDKAKNIFLGQIQPTPGLVTSIVYVLQSIISYNSNEACTVILEMGILESLSKVLGDLPVSTCSCENHIDSLDTINMYISVCRLLTICATNCREAHSLLLQSHCCINYLFAMINYNLYCKTSKTIIALQRELWCEIFRFLTALLMDFSDGEKTPGKEHSGFFAINNCISQNGIDHFISSLYIAVTSEELDLRTAAFQFLINLFRLEMETSAVTIRDIFDRKILSESVQLSRRGCHKELVVAEDLDLDFGVRLADVLMQIFLLGSSTFDFGGGHSSKNLVANALSSLFGVTRTAQNYCLDKEFGGCLIDILKQICVKLNLESVTNLRKLSDKKRIGRFLTSLETLFQLITNLVFNNKKVKNDIADRGLSIICHKLWPWCICEPSLFIVTLRMLCTFTSNCDQSCRTMVMSSSFSVISLKKSPGSVTLMNAIANQVPEEMELISKNHDCQILCLCLQLLSNCCRVPECRSVIPKGNFLQSFTWLETNKKKRPYSIRIIESWLKFFVSFSSHQEGQLVLCKNQDVLDTIMVIAEGKANHRVDALTVLRNICFNRSNRFRILRIPSFLSLLLTVLDFDRKEEVQPVVVALWALSSNSQRAKLILRSAKFEPKLESAKRNFVLSNDDETVNLIETVLKILKNR